MAQSILPNWVRGRALAVYLTVFNGAMAAGSLGWGLVGAADRRAGHAGWPAPVGLAVAGFVFHRVKLPTGEADLLPSNHWPEPLLGRAGGASTAGR